MHKSGASKVTLGALCIAALSLACSPAPQYPECKTDAVCVDHHQVCSNGFCRDCRDDAQCGAREQCSNGGCFTKPECNDDSSCAPGLLCRAGKCTPECSQSSVGTDCAQGQRCMSHRCVTAQACEGDGECGMGSACVEGMCRPQGAITGAIPASAPMSCVAGPIYFTYEESTLDARARSSVSRAWACLQREGFHRVQLSGNTDERGTREYNLALGNRRAEAVRKYLIGLGADGRKLRCVSFGKERPRDLAHDEPAWTKNRRVEIDLER